MCWACAAAARVPPAAALLARAAETLLLCAAPRGKPQSHLPGSQTRRRSGWRCQRRRLRPASRPRPPASRGSARHAPRCARCCGAEQGGARRCVQVCGAMRLLCWPATNALLLLLALCWRGAVAARTSRHWLPALRGAQRRAARHAGRRPGCATAAPAGLQPQPQQPGMQGSGAARWQANCCPIGPTPVHTPDWRHGRAPATQEGRHLREHPPRGQMRGVWISAASAFG